MQLCRSDLVRLLFKGYGECSVADAKSPLFPDVVTPGERQQGHRGHLWRGVDDSCSPAGHMVRKKKVKRKMEG